MVGISKLLNGFLFGGRLCMFYNKKYTSSHRIFLYDKLQRIELQEMTAGMFWIDRADKDDTLFCR